jgi:hypothetical protein
LDFKTALNWCDTMNEKYPHIRHVAKAETEA